MGKTVSGKKWKINRIIFLLKFQSRKNLTFIDIENLFEIPYSSRTLTRKILLGKRKKERKKKKCGEYERWCLRGRASGVTDHSYIHPPTLVCIGTRYILSVYLLRILMNIKFLRSRIFRSIFRPFSMPCRSQIGPQLPVVLEKYYCIFSWKRSKL